MKSIKTIHDLILDTKNANKGTERGRKLLESSLRRFGAGRSIVVDKHGKVIGGNKTTEVAADVGIDDLVVVPTDGRQLVVVQRTDLDLDDPETRAMAIADNRASEIGLDWDKQQIADLISEDDQLLAGLFEKEELDDLLADLAPEPEEEHDPNSATSKADELQQKWGTALGQIWQLGDHRLACGDCQDIELLNRLTDGDRADIVITDPPYGMRLDTDYTGFSGDSPRARAFNRAKGYTTNKDYHPVIADDQDYDPSALMALLHNVKEQFWFGADYYADKIPNRNDGAWLVWDKCTNEEAESSSFDQMYGSSFELLWSKQKHKRSIIRFRYKLLFGTETQDIHERIHPTQKPLQVIEWILSRYSAEHDLCLDLYLGSGTTLMACQRLNRKCYGCEIDPGYVAVILERWATFTGQQPERIDNNG